MEANSWSIEDKNKYWKLSIINEYRIVKKNDNKKDWKYNDKFL